MIVLFGFDYTDKPLGWFIVNMLDISKEHIRVPSFMSKFGKSVARFSVFVVL
jgi:hypothetical protein